MQPTQEQSKAIDLFKSGSALKINAFAGSGKTTTLVLISQATKKQGLYLAFNKSIATDAARKFPDNTRCSTVHSLAFRSLVSEYGADKMVGHLNPHTIKNAVQIKRLKIGDSISMDEVAVAGLVLLALKKFMQSDSNEIVVSHVPILGALSTLELADQHAIAEEILKHSKKMWAQMLSSKTSIPLGHDGYLKVWAMRNPKLQADHVLLDESQDTNGVVLGVLKSQLAQMVYVGDRHQQIYEWRGAINAMNTIETSHSSSLTLSFRFGDAIASLANRVLYKLGESELLVGNQKVKSRVKVEGHADTILCRTNALAIRETLNALDAGKTPHVVGGIKDFLKMLEEVRHLKKAIPSSLPEFFGFQTWSHVELYANSPEGQELRTFVKLVETYGEEKLIKMLNRSASAEADADVVVSTAHKAKGREWGSVRLANDFVDSTKKHPEANDAKAKEAELRLLYVALTRAKKLLVIPEQLRDQILGNEISKKEEDVDLGPSIVRPLEIKEPVPKQTLKQNFPTPRNAETVSWKPPKNKKSKKNDSPWSVISMTDLGAPLAICEHCKRETVRYLHTVQNHVTGETLEVGVVCAGHLTGDVEFAQELSDQAKLYFQRRNRWLKRKWRISEKGNRFLNWNQKNLVVFRNQSGSWGYVCDSKFSDQKYETEAAAKMALFEAVESVV